MIVSFITLLCLQFFERCLYGEKSMSQKSLFEYRTLIRDFLMGGGGILTFVRIFIVLFKCKYADKSRFWYE